MDSSNDCSPFTRDEIRGLLGGRPASEMLSFRSPSFKQLGLQREALVDDQLIDLMLGEPGLIRRPVVRVGNNVYFGADRSALESLISYCHGHNTLTPFSYVCRPPCQRNPTPEAQT